MVRLLDEWKPHLLEIDERHVEAAMRPRALDEPVGDGKTGAALTNTADNHTKLSHAHSPSLTTDN
jgi:hypothetical protein